MDPNTGHLVKITDENQRLLEEGYKKIPSILNEEAQKKLAEQHETYVDLDIPSPLSQWAADHRRRKKKIKDRNRRLRKERKRLR